MNNSSLENYSWWTFIDKLMFWKAGIWSKYEARDSELKLRVNFDQLIISQDYKIIETFNMNSKLKGIYKGEVLIIIVNIGQEVRKIKFQIRNNSIHYFKKLGENFPVVGHKQTSKSTITFRNIEDILRRAIEEPATNNATLMPSHYEDFVKLCLCDPMFPHVVQETQKILQPLLKKETNTV